MSRNPELLIVIAFGTAALLGVAGAPIWIATVIGALYGTDELASSRESSASRKEASQATVQQQSNAVALRMGAILLAYGVGLTLRILGNA